MPRKVTLHVYHNGKKINPYSTKPAAKAARNVLDGYLVEMEKNKTYPVMFFDIDGTLLPGAIGTKYNKSKYNSVRAFVNSNKAAVKEFKSVIKELSKRGMQIGINTGRGMGFVKNVTSLMFPKNSLDFIIAEAGAAIAYNDGKGGWTKTVSSQSVNPESSKYLKKHKAKIEKIVQELLGHLEEGKEVIVSANPPHHKMSTKDFKKLILHQLSKAGHARYLNVNHSNTAVDISPQGTDKLYALHQLLGKNYAIYLGDAQNDEAAMTGAVVVAVPGNAEKTTKAVARKSVFGLIAKSENLNGTLEALHLINEFWPR